MSKYDFDLVVIGGGIAGFVASSMANGLGKKVAIVEKEKMGGNCALLTCIPKKALVKASSMARQANNIERFGLKTSNPLSINSDGVMDYVRSIVEEIYQQDTPESFERIGVKVYSGKAQFIDKHSIRVADREITSNRFIVASGSRAMVPPIKGLSEVPYLTNENLFNIKTLPKSIIVLGGGPAGMELGAALFRLGTKVTLIEVGQNILAREDRELTDLLKQKLSEEGMAILTSQIVDEVSQQKDNVRVSIRGKDGDKGLVEAESILVTLGRKTNTENMGLEKAGIQYNKRASSPI